MWHWVALNEPLTLSPFARVTLYEPAAADADALKEVRVSVPPVALLHVVVDVPWVHTVAVAGMLEAEPLWMVIAPGPLGRAAPHR